jgi:hypothetical protein
MSCCPIDYEVVLTLQPVLKLWKKKISVVDGNSLSDPVIKFVA